MAEREHDPLSMPSADALLGGRCGFIFIAAVCLLVVYGAARVLYQAFTK